MSKAEFYTFCKQGASINHVVDTPERKSDRMYRQAKENLEERKHAANVHKQKQAADIDAECTFVPSCSATKEYHQHTTATTTATTNNNQQVDAANNTHSRFDQLYTNGIAHRKQRDENAMRQKRQAEQNTIDACSFSPKVNRHAPSTSTPTSSSNVHPTPPTKGSPSSTRAIAASARLYKQAISRQQRVQERATRKIRMEGDQCKFERLNP